MKPKTEDHIFEIMRKYVTTLHLLQEESDSGMHVISDDAKVKMFLQLDDYITELNTYFIKDENVQT